MWFFLTIMAMEIPIFGGVHFKRSIFCCCCHVFLQEGITLEPQTTQCNPWIFSAIYTRGFSKTLRIYTWSPTQPWNGDLLIMVINHNPKQAVLNGWFPPIFHDSHDLFNHPIESQLFKTAWLKTTPGIKIIISLPGPAVFFDPNPNLLLPGKLTCPLKIDAWKIYFPLK